MNEKATKELEDVDKQISNIVSAITPGFAYDECKIKMEELKDRKTKLETTLREKEARSQAPQITEEQVKNLFSMFRGFVKERNIPECKKFIQNYVDKVIVYKDHVEIIFNVVFNILKDYEAYKIRSSILFKMYINIA